MKEMKITTGSILNDFTNRKKFRIIFTDSEKAMLCEMNNTDLNIFPLYIRDIFDMLADGNGIIEEDSSDVYDYESFNDQLKNDYKKCLAFTADLDKHYGPDYYGFYINTSSETNQKLMDKYQLNRPKFWRYVRKYFQSGRNPYALLDKRKIPHKRGNYEHKVKPGRKNTLVQKGKKLDDIDRKNFDKAIRHYRSGRYNSFHSVYDRMLYDNYSKIIISNNVPKTVLLPIYEYPTFRQFYYYAHKKLERNEIKAIKTSPQEFKNNNRLLESDSLYNVHGPGYVVEMDAVETDISLVSEFDRNRCIGRAIIYLMVDVYTRAIIAVSVALENNSVQGLTNCLINLAEDKRKFCAKYGVELDNPKAWPSNILPGTLRFDRGSDFKSIPVKNMLNSLNIKFSLVPGGTGSLKGVVEQKFHQFNSSVSSIVENHGRISDRHDSKHHEESTLTLRELTTIVIKWLLYHNTLKIEKYQQTPDMIHKEIEITPASLWEYGCEFYGSPSPIPSILQYSYDLMTVIPNAKLSKKGIYLDGLYYHNPGDQELRKRMYQLENRTEKFECRMDVRDVGTLYYIRDNLLLTAVLNPKKTGNADYAGLTRKEYQDVLELKKQTSAKSIEKEQQMRSEFQNDTRNIVKDSSKKKYGKSSTKNMRKSRKTEAAILESSNTISSRLLDDESHIKQEVTDVITEKPDNDDYISEEDFLKRISAISSEDALNAFWANENNEYYE